MENQETANERSPRLLETPVAIRFASYEPPLGPVNLARYVATGFEHDQRLLHWVIAGGESGPDARPSHPNWFRSARDQRQAAGAAFFLKQWGEWTSYSGDYTDLHLSSARPAHRIMNGQFIERAGRKRSSRLLDGREWNEFPKDSAPFWPADMS
ncbi:MAG: DUF5131 family protein [Terriglobia bacterium]